MKIVLIDCKGERWIVPLTICIWHEIMEVKELIKISDFNSF